jgi:hypothetical protein
MAYALANITQEDREKIKRDASSSPDKLRWLNAAEQLDAFPLTWALDLERDCYLMPMPIESRGDTNDVPYLMHVEGQLYKIERVGAYADLMHFDEDSLPSVDKLRAVEGEVTAAFAVYGCWGDGPLNERGQLEFAVVPEFTKKGA